MTQSTPWRGNPLPNAYTLITSGYYSDLQAAVVPAGFIDLDRVGVDGVGLTLYGGQFSTGTQLYSEGVGGATTLTFNGVNAQASWFYQYGHIDDRLGELDMNVVGGENFYNYGTIGVDSSTTSNQVIAITLSHNVIGYMGSTLFENFGLMTVNGNSPKGFTGTMNVNALANTEFLNAGSMDVSQVHGSINFFGAGTIVNNGYITAENGAQISFQGSGLSGQGAVSASSGSRIQIGAPVGAGETINLSNSTLEFWVQPKMSFMGKIAGMDASDTILVDQTYATHDAFVPLSQAGAGLGELYLFDAQSNVVGAFQMVGHYNQNNFALTPHATPTGNWTALTEHVAGNSPGLAHS